VFCFSILKTNNTRQKIKKGVSERHAHIKLAAFTFVHSLRSKSKDGWSKAGWGRAKTAYKRF